MIKKAIIALHKQVILMLYIKRMVRIHNKIMKILMRQQNNRHPELAL